jgi:hypothetical protein
VDVHGDQVSLIGPENVLLQLILASVSLQKGLERTDQSGRWTVSISDVQAASLFLMPCPEEEPHRRYARATRGVDIGFGVTTALAPE